MENSTEIQDHLGLGSLGLTYSNNCSRTRTNSIYINHEDKRGTEKFTLTYANGGQYCEAKREKFGWGNKVNRPPGSTRGNVEGLSVASRANLMKTVKKLNKSSLNEKEVLFITLTYDQNTEENLKLTGKDYKRHLKNITQAIIRKYDGFGVWKFELQKRLIGHFHIIWYKNRYIDINWLLKRWNEITNGSEAHAKIGVDLQVAKNWKGVNLYCSKTLGYISKEEKCLAKIKQMKKIQIGRCWGTCNKQELRKHINLKQMVVPRQTYILIDRAIRKAQQVFKRQAGNIKGMKITQGWQKAQNGLVNLARTVFLENEAFKRLVSWAAKATGFAGIWEDICNETKEGFIVGLKGYKETDTNFRLVGAS